MNLNPWHNVSIGEEAPKFIDSIIEIPRGSNAKYEIDKDSGLIRLDRVLSTSFFYPTNYGFIPQTLGDDNDPLDILVISQVDILPLSIVRAKVIGVMKMIDNGEGDDKIIAVCADDVNFKHIDSLDELPPYFQKNLKHFFEEYKNLENKKVIVEGFFDQKVAFDIIEKSIDSYNKKYK